jgi:hypothetical protein
MGDAFNSHEHASNASLIATATHVPFTSSRVAVAANLNVNVNNQIVHAYTDDVT